MKFSKCELIGREYALYNDTDSIKYNEYGDYLRNIEIYYRMLIIELLGNYMTNEEKLIYMIWGELNEKN